MLSAPLYLSIRVPGVNCRPTGRFLAILSAKFPLNLCSRLHFFEPKHTTSTLCTCESSHLDFKCGSARCGGIGYCSTMCMKGIVYLDMLQEFLIPRTKVTRRDAFTSSKTARKQVAKVMPEVLRGVWRETDYRWDFCRITNGSHIEP